MTSGGQYYNVHFLKTWPEYFRAIIEGRKKCEIRYDDRDFRVGDRLILCEHNPNGRTWDPWMEQWHQGADSGRQYRVIVTDLLLPSDLVPLPVGYVLMSIQPDGWRSENPWEYVNRLEDQMAEGDA